MGGMMTEAQRAALAALSRVVTPEFYLAGGQAIAARLHHRTSHDLDLFTTSDPTELLAALQRLDDVVITGQAPGTVHLRIGSVPASLLTYPYALLQPATAIDGFAVPVASLEDLAPMKLAAISHRGAARDFWDLHEIIQTTQRPLKDWLAVFQRKYPKVDVGHVVRSLGYFDDAEADELPVGLDRPGWERIRADFEAWVKGLMATP